MASGKLKVTLGMRMVRYGRDRLGPGTLKLALSQLRKKIDKLSLIFTCWKRWNKFWFDH